MSASDALHPTLFHGTASDIKGDIIPASVGGQASHWGNTGSDRGQPSREHAFATTDESTAWSFAETAAKKTGERARVHRVDAPEGSRPGVHTALHEHIAPRFTPVERHDIQPNRQGTFPDLNWNQFRARETPEGQNYYEAGMHEDANHPDNERVHGREVDVHDHLDDAMRKYKTSQRSNDDVQMPGHRLPHVAPNDRELAFNDIERHLVSSGQVAPRGADEAASLRREVDVWGR